MNYWHIQMHLPYGRNEEKIDSRQMLGEESPVIGTGEWDNRQCRCFKDADGEGMKNGDIILVREGERPMALCQVIGECFDDNELTSKYGHIHYRKVKVLDFYTGNEVFPVAQGTLQRLVSPTTKSMKFMTGWYNKVTNDQKETVSQDNELTQLLKFKHQIILQGPPGTGKTFTAKDIAYQMIFGKEVDEDKRKEQMLELERSGQFELIQFHPAFSYEDFVRGITAKSDGNAIEYKTEDKILMLFAKAAIKNYADSQKSPDELAKNQQIEKLFADFADSIEEEIAEAGKYELTQKVSICEVESDAFRYKGDAWNSRPRMHFENIILLYEKNIRERKAIKNIEGFCKSGKEHATYYFAVLNKFKEFVKAKKESERSEKEARNKEELKNYVLVIDEINRANLPAVLGELIYAMEYRGEVVKSMYEIDGEQALSLPPNLYIIGTMNTADRSVGNIDYAIRRRFGFYSLLPERTVVEEIAGNEEVKEKALKLFGQVETLFDNFLSCDFRKQDVQLGHSYFLADSFAVLEMKLKYEIRPLLYEYLKDGVLKEEAEKEIAALSL